MKGAKALEFAKLLSASHECFSSTTVWWCSKCQDNRGHDGIFV